MRPSKNVHNKTSAFQMFNQRKHKNYPLNLLQLIDDSQTSEYQRTKAQYLLQNWTIEYRKMKSAQKYIYIGHINKILSLLYSSLAKQRKVQKCVALMYFQSFKKWNQITKYLSIGLQNNQITQLKLLWSITFTLIQGFEPIIQTQFAKHLSQKFEQNLCKYQWKYHQQKIYILQILKHINSHVQHDRFINNGKKWVNMMKKMLRQQFVSEIKIKNSYAISLYDFQKRIQMQINSYENPGKSNQKNIDTTQKHQITPFLVVSNRQEQQQIYKIQLYSQIIQIKSLLFIIDSQFWHMTTLSILNQIQSRLSNLSSHNTTDIIYAQILNKLLLISNVQMIVKDKYIESFIIKIVQNSKQRSNIFSMEKYQGIFDVLNQIAFVNYNSSDMSNQQNIIKRIRNIINQGIKGKDDLVNRSMMEIRCRYSIQLELQQLLQLATFLTNGKNKKIVLVETYLIIAKIFLNSLKIYNKLQMQMIPIFLELPIIVQFCFQQSFSQKNHSSTHDTINSLRNTTIQIFIHLLSLIEPDTIEQQQIIVLSIFKWLKLVEINTKHFHIPMLRIIYLLIRQHTKIVKIQSFQYVQIILTGMNLKLNQQANVQQHIYLYLNCLIQCIDIFSWSAGCQLFVTINPVCFQDQKILYKQQGSLLLKQFNKVSFMRKQAQQQNHKSKTVNDNRNNLQTRSRRKSYGRGSTTLNSTNIINQSSISQTQSSLINMQRYYNYYFQEQDLDNIQQIICSDIIAYGYNQYECKASISKLILLVFQFLVIRYRLTIEQQYENFQKNHAKNNKTNTNQLKNLINNNSLEIINTPPSNRIVTNDQKCKQMLIQMDSDLLVLYQRLTQAQKYVQMFDFASKIYYLPRDFFFVSTLKSYQYLKQKCFEILSAHFNRSQVLSASSLFCSLMLPYIQSPIQLQQVYQILNEEQFLTDLFKGSNQFIGKQENYHSDVIVIFLVFWMTKDYRKNIQSVEQCMVSLRKNVIWWADIEFEINPDIIQEKYVESSKEVPYVLNYFKEMMKSNLHKYYSELLRIKIQEQVGKIKQ